MAESERLYELQQKFNENPRRYFAPLANELRKRGDYSRAIDLCRTYLPHLPGHMSGFIVYGQSLFDGEQYDEAATAFNDALNVDPENVIALRHLGDIARIQGDAPTAIEWYQQVLEFDPKNEEISAYIDELSTVDAAEPVTTYVRPAGWFSPQAEQEAAFLEANEPKPESVLDVVSEAFADDPVADNAGTIADEAVTGGAEASEDSTTSEEYEDLVWIDAEQLSEPASIEADPVTSSVNTEAKIEPEETSPAQLDDLVFIDYSELDNSTIDNSTVDNSALDSAQESDAPDFSDSSDFIEGVAAPVAPFVTETLANLYMDQGLYSEALTVLKQLAETRDAGDPIFDKIAEVEERLRPEPTVREFFSMIGPDDISPAFNYIGEL